jgi:hypothetical protein
MGEFCRKDHFSGGVIDDGDASGFAAWIDLDPERLEFWLLYSNLQDDGKWETLEDRGFPLGQEQSRSSRVDRIEWLLIGI